MRRSKRILSAILALCLILTSGATNVWASGVENENFELLMDNGEEAEPQILSLMVANGIATVGYQYKGTDALIGVAIYDKASGRMLAYNSSDLSVEDNGTVLIALGGSIPDEFSAKAFLLRKGTMTPLCQAFELTEIKPQIECAELDSNHITTEVLTVETAAGEEFEYEVQYVNNELIVVGSEGTTAAQIGEFVSAYGGSVIGYIQALGYYQVELSTPVDKVDDLNQIISEWSKSPLIETAWVNTVSEYGVDSSVSFPNDSWGGSSWSEDYPSGNNWWFEAIYAASAQQLLINRYGSRAAVPRVAVGVMDGCFDTNHPDLRFTSVLSFQNGVDITNVAALAQNATDSDSYTGYKHGTHVAGIIAATGNNGTGMTGIALNTDLHGYELLDRNGKQESELKKGWTTSIFSWMTSVGYLIEKGCRVINYSAGYNMSDSNKQMKTALSGGDKMGEVLQGYLDKGYDFIIVTSAGNGKSANTDAQYNNSFAAVSASDYPDVYDRVIVVGGASEYYGSIGSFAFVSEWNSGSRIDVTAPGLNIYSTVPANGTFSGGSQYVLAGGTSVASPCVAGVATLILEADPTLTGSQVKRIICETADIPVGGTDNFGNTFNMVNAQYAVSRALNRNYSISGESDNGIQWKLGSDGVLSISGTTSIVPTSSTSDVLSSNGFYYERSNGTSVSYYPWDRHQNKIKAIELADGITGIAEKAFCYTIESAVIPRSVAEIGEYAVGFSWPDEDSVTDEFIIYGYSNTVAEQYAKDNGIHFLNLNLSEREPNPAGDFIVKGGMPGTDWLYNSGILSILTDSPLLIHNANLEIPTSDRIYIEDGVNANITLAGVNISASGAAFQIATNSTGNVTITLAENSENKLQCSDPLSGAGLIKSRNRENVGELIINGSGKLTAISSTGYGSVSHAGIGGAKGYSTKNITITGSVEVTAIGGGEGAGIGGGSGGSAHNITISGSAKVTATGGIFAAGIGGGYSGSGSNIIICDFAQVVASNNSDGGAGIGGGGHGGTASNITICDYAEVTAIGGRAYSTSSGGAGIGGGGGYAYYYNNAGGNAINIIVSDFAEVIATGGNGGGRSGGGAGIGGGGGYSGGEASSVTITLSTTVISNGGDGGDNSYKGANIGYGGGKNNAGAEIDVVETA